MGIKFTDWHHSPPHRFEPRSSYIVTAATLHQCHLFRGDQRLRFLEGKLLEMSMRYNWVLQEWAVFSNHYHWVGWANPKARPFSIFAGAIHSATARWVNQLDGTRGRKVWHEFWDTRISLESSYWARLSYVHHNPLRHRLVSRPEDYPYCSARRVLEEGLTSRTKLLRSYGYERIRIHDDYDPIW